MTKKQNHSSKVMAQNKTSAFKITLHNAYNAKCYISHAAQGLLYLLTTVQQHLPWLLSVYF